MTRNMITTMAFPLILTLTLILGLPQSWANESNEDQIGVSIVLKLREYLAKAENLSRHLTILAKAGLEEKKLKEITKNLLDNDGDFSIAGGGLWFEPHQFHVKRDRYSFFWARNQQENLTFIDDYNKEGPGYNEINFLNDPAYKDLFLKSPGYHNEEWYVIGKTLDHSRKGIWSQSYTDPYSFEPMVTFTAPIRDQRSTGEVLLGVATVDLKLKNIFQLCQEWGKAIHGNVFILDRNGKVISFFDYDESRVLSHDAQSGKVKDEYLPFQEIIKKITEYKPIWEKIEGLDNQWVTQHQDPALAKVIDEMSYQLDRQEALTVTAINRDQRPLPSFSQYLLAKIPLAKDPYLKGKAMSYLFNVPETYWKVVVILPETPGPKQKRKKS